MTPDTKEIAPNDSSGPRAWPPPPSPGVRMKSKFTGQARVSVVCIAKSPAHSCRAPTVCDKNIWRERKTEPGRHMEEVCSQRSDENKTKSFGNIPALSPVEVIVWLTPFQVQGGMQSCRRIGESVNSCAKEVIRGGVGVEKAYTTQACLA